MCLRLIDCRKEFIRHDYGIEACLGEDGKAVLKQGILFLRFILLVICTICLLLSLSRPPLGRTGVSRPDGVILCLRDASFRLIGRKTNY